MWTIEDEFFAAKWKCGNIRIFIHRQSYKEQDEHIFSYTFYPDIENDDYCRMGKVEAYSLEDAQEYILHEVKDNINAEILMWKKIRYRLIEQGEW